MIDASSSDKPLRFLISPMAFSPRSVIGELRNFSRWRLGSFLRSGSPSSVILTQPRRSSTFSLASPVKWDRPASEKLLYSSSNCSKSAKADRLANASSVRLEQRRRLSTFSCPSGLSLARPALVMSVFSSDRFFSSASLATLSMPRSEISAPHNSNFVSCGKVLNRSRSASVTCARQVDAGYGALIILGQYPARLFKKRDVLRHVGPGLRRAADLAEENHRHKHGATTQHNRPSKTHDSFPGIEVKFEAAVCRDAVHGHYAIATRTALPIDFRSALFAAGSK